MFSKIYLVIFKYLAIFKYAPMSKWQFNSTLASFSLLANYPSIKTSNEAFFNFSHIAKTVKFLPDTIILLNE